MNSTRNGAPLVFWRKDLYTSSLIWFDCVPRFVTKRSHNIKSGDSSFRTIKPGFIVIGISLHVKHYLSTHFIEINFGFKSLTDLATFSNSVTLLIVDLSAS